MGGDEARVRLNLYAEGYHAGLAEAERRTREFEKQTGKSFGKVNDSLKNSGSAAKLGAEQITKYGTAAAALTGQMGNLPVAGDAIAKTLATVQAAMSGMLGAAGLAVVAIGALTAGIVAAIQEQKRYKEATDQATESILKQAAVKGIGGSGSIAGAVIGAKEPDLLKQKADLMARLSALQDGVNRGVMVYKGSGFEVSLTESRDAVSDLSIQADKLQKALDGVNVQLEQIRKARAGGEVKPGDLVGPPAPGWDEIARRMEADREAATAKAARDRDRATSEARLLAEDAESRAGRRPRIAGRGGRPGTRPVEAEVTPEASTEISEYQKIEQAAQASYQSIGAAGSAAYRVISAEAAKATSLQKLMQLQLGKAYIQSVRQGLAAYLDTKAQAAMADAAEYAYKAIAALATGNVWAAGQYGAAAAMAGLRGGAFALGAGLIRGGAGAAGGGQTEGGLAGSAGDVGGGRTASAGLVTSGGQAQALTYNVTVIHQGATVYGDGGIRQLWLDDLVPLLREFLQFRTA